MRIAMYRNGHVGIVLLFLSPFLYTFLRAGRPFLALLSLGVLVIEPLPNRDQRFDGFRNRGTSHTFFTAALVGWLCAGGGWVLGTYVTAPIADWLSTTGINAFTWIVVRFSALDAPTLSAVGWCVGSSGIVLHLLGDIITGPGVQPLLPFSKRRVSFVGLHPDSRLANGLLFGLGAGAILLVALLATPLGSVLQTGLTLLSDIPTP
ncbi:metal-dependent hydrolase [Halocatena marina]|nr:metal-dependent hydrolase [Halocatena marina]